MITDKDLLDSLFNKAKFGLIISNESGQILKVNIKAKELFGYSDEEFRELSFEKILMGKFQNSKKFDKEQILKIDKKVDSNESVEFDALKKDGTKFQVEITESQIKNDEGNFSLTTINDISEIRRRRDFVNNLNNELLEYTSILETSNKDLEQFAYIVSHDLQEPLRKITAFAALLKAGNPDIDDKSKEYINRMVSASMRMQNLVSDLLMFSSISTKSKPFSLVDLNIVLKEVLSDMEISIQQVGAKVTSENLPSVMADPSQMRQLFQNLISNSCKFKKENQAPLIQISWIEGNEEDVILTFKDNGIGFDEKYQDKIFLIFQRLEGHKYEGSGIGLALCNRIVKRHGGKITANSTIGEGTTFRIMLPKNQQSVKIS